MAGLSKKFKLDGYEKQFEVKELSVGQIIDLVNAGISENDVSVEKFLSLIKDDLLPATGNILIEDLQEMFPSDIMQIWEKFKEVNDSFFVVARAAGLDQILMSLREIFFAEFGSLLARLSKRVMPGS